MNNVASKIPSLWYSFGTQLDIPGGTLRAIRGNTDKDCFLEVFHIWKSSQSRLPISWSTVIDVLDSNSIAEYALASHLRSKYCVYWHSSSLVHVYCAHYIFWILSFSVLCSYTVVYTVMTLSLLEICNWCFISDCIHYSLCTCTGVGRWACEYVEEETHCFMEMSFIHSISADMCCQDYSMSHVISCTYSWQLLSLCCKFQLTDQNTNSCSDYKFEPPCGDL